MTGMSSLPQLANLHAVAASQTYSSSMRIDTITLLMRICGTEAATGQKGRPERGSNCVRSTRPCKAHAPLRHSRRSATHARENAGPQHALPAHCELCHGPNRCAGPRSGPNQLALSKGRPHRRVPHARRGMPHGLSQEPGRTLHFLPSSLSD